MTQLQKNLSGAALTGLLSITLVLFAVPGRLADFITPGMLIIAAAMFYVFWFSSKSSWARLVKSVVAAGLFFGVAYAANTYLLVGVANWLLQGPPFISFIYTALILAASFLVAGLIVEQAAKRLHR